MRTDFLDDDVISLILYALTPANSLVCKTILITGWRIDDVLNLKTAQIERALQQKRHCITIVEKKTGKHSTKVLPVKLLGKISEQSGIIYAFQGRDDYRKHRTRQAVYLDLKKVSKRFGIKVNFSPHSLRKNYAVYLRRQGKSVEEIQKILNHDNIATTMIYAMADELTQKYK